MIRLLLIVCGILSVVAVSAQASKKPNIIFILADDLGYGDVGFNGQERIKTPNLDRLAREGMVFSQFYAGTTVCAPSRSSLISGQHTGHTFIRGNKGVEPEGQYPIPDSLFTLAEALKAQGYTTGAFGKWGLGPVGSEGDPNKQGFDQFYGYNCQSLAHRYYPTHLWHNDQKVILEENGNLEYQRQYAPDLIQQEALSFVTENKERPFFLFLPYILPHAELLVPDDSLFDRYKGTFAETPHQGDDYGSGAKPGGYASQPYPRATFAAMVSRLDVYVGQLVERLKELGIDEQTLIVFSSDNGPHVEGGADPQFFNSGGGLRGFKRDLYEGGIRVPFVARWPAKIKSNQTNAHIGAFWDLLPTFVELAGGEAPENVDGISFAGTLLGGEQPKQHDYLYWEFHERGGKQAVRYGKWKGVRLNVLTDPQAPIELYDLESDVAETHDVAASHPDIVQQIETFMEASHTESEVFPFIP
ncbi:arylsulfatase [Parapedobacter sp. DT-150]|uniref:arylsulfatase n=1 Tax=Parapedobacter sp. DT-150 TaxID=3396162 RepID=UPI003F1C8591